VFVRKKKRNEEESAAVILLSMYVFVVDVGVVVVNKIKFR
jgi:hypothetical protein